MSWNKSAPETGQLVISEIQDDPRGRDVGREFVELYNPQSGSQSLEGWWLQNCADRRVDLSGRLGPGEFLVVAGPGDRDENGILCADATLEELQLSNGSGSSLLFNADNRLVDQVRYDSASPGPQRDTGQSLELRALGGDNSNGGYGVPGAMSMVQVARVALGVDSYALLQAGVSSHRMLGFD